MYRFSRLLLVVFLLISSLEMFSQKPDSTCENAGIFCDSASLYGPWELYDTVYGDNVPHFNICETQGSFQNITYFSFVASSNHVKILLTPELITPHKGTSDIGYQYGLIGFCVNQSNKNDIIYYDCSAVANVVNPEIIESFNLNPGYTYYLYVDGYSGAYMQFHLEVLDGIGDLKVDDIDKFYVSGHGAYDPNDTIEVCKDGTFDFTVLGVDNAPSYIWYSQDTLESSDSSTLVYTFNSDTTIYKICAQGYTDCEVGNPACIYVKVDTIADDILPDTSVCASDLSVGVKPSGWLGGLIKSTTGGVFWTNVNDSIGCHYIQRVRINKIDEDINDIDTVLCAVDSFFINGDTMTNDFMLQYKYSSIEGCDSFVNKYYLFFNYEGDISKLECFNGSSYILSVNSQNYNPGKYDSVKVTWLLNNNVISEGSSFDLYPVDLPGKYYAQVTLYKGGLDCTFDLPEVVIENIPSAEFIVSKDTICSNDSLFFELTNYIDTIIYNIDVEGTVAQKLSESKYKVKWGNEGNYKIRITFMYDGCPFAVEKEIEVQPEIQIPLITCIQSTNSSIVFDWNTSECVDGYEIWIDGVYVKTMSSGPDTIQNLNYGQEVNIEVRTIGDCVCEHKTDNTNCSALPCPNRTVSITGLPQSICYDELVDSIILSYEADTTIIANWTGGVVDDFGVVYKSNIVQGINSIILKYQVGDCNYQVDTSFIVYPPLDIDLVIGDLSCFDSKDGSVEILPKAGTASFSVELNGETRDSLYIDNLIAGEYKMLLLDDNGCTYQDTFYILQPEEPEISIKGNKIVKYNSEFKYYIEASDTGFDSIYWYKNDSLICTGNCDTVTIKPENDFNLCAQMFFDSLCQKETCIDVRIDRDFEIYVPNIFTPDFDGINDYFNIKSTNGLDVHVKTLKIFNRWGELLYENNDFIVGSESGNLGWNGIFRGKKALPGVYVYYIEIVDDSGEISKLYGDVTLIR